MDGNLGCRSCGSHKAMGPVIDMPAPPSDHKTDADKKEAVRKWRERHSA
jgi:hypothetical protein